MNYKDVVVEENEGKVYICKLKNGQTLELQVHDDCKSSTANFVMYNFEDSEDAKEYLEEDVDVILEQVLHDWHDDEPDVDNIDWKELEQYYMVDDNVFAYNSRDELDKIIKYLDNPIISGTGITNNYDHLFKHEFGLVFYWSEYDDFSCYGDGYTHYIKIISGAKIV